MLNAVKECASWLDWKFVAGGVAVLLALAACAKLPGLSMFAGAAPLLLLAVCLIPCLLPLAWLRNLIRDKATQAPASENDLDR